ncbi:homoserine O-acetyltransferase [Halolamina sp.]|jgi:homoserine O-acetyltransferase|uniref:homoserine O-acetyltransferase MetX n=1 Tax=Halolamina sp. TaxID=1940283 RepID=UPI000223B933|nr:Homoserine O-acetyltransferase [halophilic archaeon DL31]
MTGNTPPAHEAGTVEVGRFEFDRAGTVPNLELAYESYGSYEPDGGPKGAGNAVLVCHALTGSQHVATTGAEAGEGAAGQASGWWGDIVGPEKAIDTTEYFVICVNVPGSCYGSTGPSSEHPDGGHWGSAFPPVTVPDWTRAQRRLLAELSVESLHAVVGGSVGGMNTLDWARQFPELVDRIAPVATASRLDAQLLGINGVARRAIRSDPNWQGGDYYGSDHPDHGLMLARQLGHITYLSKDSMADRFGREPTQHSTEEPFPKAPGADAFPYRSVESYLDHQADSFVDRFDANSYLWLTRAMDEFDLAAGYGSDAEALAGFDGDALVLSFTGDWHFPPDDAAALADSFDDAGASVAHHLVDSEYGHDAFLVETESVGPPLQSFLAAGVEGDAVQHVDCEEAKALVEEPCGDHTPEHPTVPSR